MSSVVNANQGNDGDQRRGRKQHETVAVAARPLAYITQEERTNKSTQSSNGIYHRSSNGRLTSITLSSTAAAAAAAAAASVP